MKFKDTEYGDLTGQVYEGDIDVSAKELDSLEGSPREVDGNFGCDFNNLYSLKGAPKIVKGHFSCYTNNLTSLEGAPKEVHGNFDCSNNIKLESLEGAPELVTGNFDCTHCPKLKSLDELLDTEIRGKLKSNIMTNEEFKELQALYNKAGKNMKKYKLLKKLKGIE